MSVIADFQANGITPSTLGGTGTTVKYFPRVLGPSIGVAPATPSATNATGQLLVPAFGEVNGQMLRVRVGGNVFNNNNGTATVSLYVNTGTPLSPTYVEIATTTALAAAATTYGFGMTVDLVAESTALQLGGLQTVIVNGTLNNATPKVTDNSPVTLTSGALTSGLAVPNAGTGFGMVVGVTFSASDAAHTAKLFQFQVALD